MHTWLQFRAGVQVGFYQLSKIAVAPAVLVAEAIFYGKRATKKASSSLVQGQTMMCSRPRQRLRVCARWELSRTCCTSRLHLAEGPAGQLTAASGGIQVVAAIALVCLGVGISTVTDSQMGSNVLGWGVGAGAVISTAAYQLWAGSMQKCALLPLQCPNSTKGAMCSECQMWAWYSQPLAGQQAEGPSVCTC